MSARILGPVIAPPMELVELVRELRDIETSGTLSTPVGDIQCRLYKVKPGDIFAAVIDYYRDDHSLIQDAIDQGAVAVLLSKTPKTPLSVPWVRTNDVGAVLGQLSSRRYQAPAEELDIVGVTGTNGKTTTTCLVEAICASSSRRAGRIGTLGLVFDGAIEAAEVLSTPEPPVLHRALRAMVQEGADTVAMEVTSHGISMGRVNDCPFKIRILTGIGHDHLDYHKTVAAYAATKVNWMLEALPNLGEFVVAPVDDPFAKEILERFGDRAASFGFSENATIHPVSIDLHESGIRGTLSTPCGDVDFTSPLIGRHNLRNVMAAVAASVFLEIPLPDIAQGLANISVVPGRLEPIENDRGFTILVDYAHTPDALEAMLSSVREFAKGRLALVLGCGGDRDTSKRPIMARIASEKAEFVVLTTDNARSEPPERILFEMKKGLASRAGSESITELDRREAIRQALRWARRGDVVIIAGKGHESVQVLDGREFYFDDRQVIREILLELR
ncbi:MAG: UDP-N-acetylmuramoyl-L-alanyl-D-glutamate--2,6-diaminopimelate ligase [Pseudomonadota bacterium]